MLHISAYNHSAQVLKMYVREPKLLNVPFIGGKEITFRRSDEDVKLVEVEWECPQCQQQDLFEKLIESSECTD